MTSPTSPQSEQLRDAPEPDRPDRPDRVEGDPAADVGPDPAVDAHQPPHPPLARTSDEYTDPPGHHRRPDGTATDVGA